MKYVKYIKNVILYFGASLIPMLLNLASNPLVAINMSPEDYAITGYYTSFSTLLSPLIVFYMLHYYTKRYFEVTSKEREYLRALLLKSLIYFSGLISGFCVVGLWMYVHYFNVESSMPFAPYALLTVFALPITGVYQMMLIDYRMGRDSSKYFKVSNYAGVMLVALTLFFCCYIEMGSFRETFGSVCCQRYILRIRLLLL